MTPRVPSRKNRTTFRAVSPTVSTTQIQDSPRKEGHSEQGDCRKDQGGGRPVEHADHGGADLVTDHPAGVRAQAKKE